VGEGDPKERRENLARILPPLRHPRPHSGRLEQGRRQPDPAASVLLRGIEQNPKVMEEEVGVSGGTVERGWFDATLSDGRVSCHP
jgi:hypothetical protein